MAQPRGPGTANLGGGFPTQSYRDSNYWVSPVFVPDSSVGQPPIITSITPTASSTSGGIYLTINGANFTPDAIAPSVYFGMTQTYLFIFSANQIIVFIPEHPAGTVNIRVVTDAGESALSPDNLFTHTL